MNGADAYTIGIDFGSQSTRALIVNSQTGEEIASAVLDYPHGVLLDERNPAIARHDPADYPEVCVAVVRAAVQAAETRLAFSSRRVIGIGIDGTASTPLPLDSSCRPLAMGESMRKRQAAMVWLWKDHSAHQEASEITEAASRHRPEYLRMVGGSYSAEWFWAKLLHCLRTDPAVFAASYTWAEAPDWLAAALCGIDDPAAMRRGTCAAGHKGLFNDKWGGYPDSDFLTLLDPELARIGRTLPSRTYPVDEPAGRLSKIFADKMGLPVGIPVAVPAIDAHIGALGCGITEKTMVKILGTSGVDMVIAKPSIAALEIEGVCGVVENSIQPNYLTIEAGQSALGDIYQWCVRLFGDAEGLDHGTLADRAAALQPGASGLLALDWMNGNRSVLNDARLTGMIVGLTLQTNASEVYRALVEATAFGARIILDRLQQNGVEVDRIVASGGIAVKSPFVMQVFADVLGKPLFLAATEQAAALGGAIAAAVVAGPKAGGQESIDSAIRQMTRLRPDSYRPHPEAQPVYGKLYRLYRSLHDSFGTRRNAEHPYRVMKELASIRDSVRGLTVADADDPFESVSSG